MNSFSQSRLNKSTLSTYNHSVATLNDKIIECWLRQNHDEYQQLLIEAKQLQLRLLQEQAKNKHLLRGFDKKKKQVQQLQTQLEQISANNVKRKNYLISYYKHLNSKLKGDASSISLMAKLDAIEKGLQKKLSNQKQGLDSFVGNVKDQISKLEEELIFLEGKKQSLRQNLQNLRKTKQSYLKEVETRKSDYRKQKIQEKQRYQFLLSQVKKLSKQKQHYQSSQNVLKKLLNIEQVHKKCWLSIQKAIKAQFVRRASERHYREAMSMEYKLKAGQMQNLVSLRKSEIQNLKGDIQNARRKRDNAQRLLEESKKKYSDVENQVKQQSPRKSGN